MYLFFPITALSGKTVAGISRAMIADNLYSCRRFPSTLATLSKLDAFIKDGTARITANVKLLNSVIRSASNYILNY